MVYGFPQPHPIFVINSTRDCFVIELFHILLFNYSSFHNFSSLFIILLFSTGFSGRLPCSLWVLNFHGFLSQLNKTHQGCIIPWGSLHCQISDKLPPPPFLRQWKAPTYNIKVYEKIAKWDSNQYHRQTCCHLAWRKSSTRNRVTKKGRVLSSTRRGRHPDRQAERGPWSRFAWMGHKVQRKQTARRNVIKQDRRWEESIPFRIGISSEPRLPPPQNTEFFCPYKENLLCLVKVKSIEAETAITTAKHTHTKLTPRLEQYKNHTFRLVLTVGFLDRGFVLFSYYDTGRYLIFL